MNTASRVLLSNSSVSACLSGGLYGQPVWGGAELQRRAPKAHSQPLIQPLLQPLLQPSGPAGQQHKVARLREINIHGEREKTACYTGNNMSHLRPNCPDISMILLKTSTFGSWCSKGFSLVKIVRLSTMLCTEWKPRAQLVTGGLLRTIMIINQNVLVT